MKRALPTSSVGGTTARARKRMAIAIAIAIAIAVAMAIASVVVARRERTAQVPVVRPLLVDHPGTLAELEENGFSFDKVVGPARLAAITETVKRDLAQLWRGAPPQGPRQHFQATWLEVGHFELIGVVNRIDRAPFDPPDSALCGEARLVYRLALAPPGRRVTRMPMTVNVRIPQRRRAGDADCGQVARGWQSDPDIAGILRALPPYTKVEINLQSVHVPTSRKDMDDNAEYVLRTFRVDGAGLAPDTLFNTPRTDLAERERSDLATWIVRNLDAIDHGTAVIPERFLATRAVSVSPRGLAHPANRPFSQIFPDARAAFGDAPLRARELVTTPELLVRRLDEGTCQGCHQTRSAAGFHLLGDERDPKVAFNALAVGRSPHFLRDLEWRARFLAGVASGSPPPTRPFAGHPNGRDGEACGLVDGFASWTCAPGFRCRDIHHAEVGVCVPSAEGELSAPCQDVRIRRSSRFEGPVISSSAPDAACGARKIEAPSSPYCIPNFLGFAGGMCTQSCATIGEIMGKTICAPIPTAGFEIDCMNTREPIEECMKRHYTIVRIPTCSAERPCRDDYECARVPGAEPGTGACVPPYFVFQLRVDGPFLDR